MADITDILIKLLERTKQGKVSWQPTSQERTVKTIVGSLAVEVDIDRDGDLMLRVLDKTGQVLEALESWSERGRDWAEVLAELHRRARNNALKVDSQLDELLRELEKDPDPS